LRHLARADAPWRRQCPPNLPFGGRRRRDRRHLPGLTADPPRHGQDHRANSRNFDDLIDTLAAVNKPPLSVVQPGIPLIPSTTNGGLGVVTVAHALGALPSTVNIFLQCISPAGDLGYSQNEVVGLDRVWVQGSFVVSAVTYYYYTPALSFSADVSRVYIVQSVPPASMFIMSKSANPALAAINPTKWAYFVYASLDYIVVQSSDPFINLQPASATVTGPAALTFVIAASGTPTLTYQWQVSTNSGASWATASGGVYSGGTTNTLSISSSSGLTGNQYRCIVTNGVSNSLISNVVTLTVM